MARGGGNSAAIAGLILIGVVLYLLFFSKQETINNFEDKLNAKFPNFDVYGAVDKMTGAFQLDKGLFGLLSKFQQRFGSDLTPEHRPPADINTGIDPLAALQAAGGATATYDTDSVLTADEGGSGGMQ
jgi:hypothetical protein